MKVRKKPVVVDAMLFDGSHECAERIVAWVNQATGYRPSSGDSPPILFYYGEMRIRTLEGEMTGGKGDWIIKGVKGEFYPCKPDIFEQTYEFVEGATLVPEPASLLELCHNILELARHGDYSNGNTAQGMDEGRVMAAQMMADYEQQLKNFEGLR